MSLTLQRMRKSFTRYNGLSKLTQSTKLGFTPGGGGGSVEKREDLEKLFFVINADKTSDFVN